jgi:hypothetical protein
MKIKELIGKLQKCNSDSEVILLTDYFDGNNYNFEQSEPEIKINSNGNVYLSEGISYPMNCERGVKYFTKDMILL